MHLTLIEFLMVCPEPAAQASAYTRENERAITDCSHPTKADDYPRRLRPEAAGCRDRQQSVPLPFIYRLATPRRSQCVTKHLHSCVGRAVLYRHDTRRRDNTAATFSAAVSRLHVILVVVFHVVAILVPF